MIDFIAPKSYYFKSDGVYRSFWVGRILNLLMRGGRKETIEVILCRSLAILKVCERRVPIIILLEYFERIKPIFSLGFVIIGGKRKDFPKLLSNVGQFNLSLKWCKQSLISQHGNNLQYRFCIELVGSRKSVLSAVTKVRDNLFVKAVENRFNIRYVY